MIARWRFAVFALAVLAVGLVSAQRDAGGGQAAQAGRGGVFDQPRGAEPAGGQQEPQQDTPRPVFRANVNAVQVDVRVVDANGNFVRDLRADEFRISEDGTAQSVTTFGRVDLPEVTDSAPMLAGTRVDPDVASNVQSAEGRVYVIVMDDKPNTLTFDGSARATTVTATTDTATAAPPTTVSATTVETTNPPLNSVLRSQTYRDLARKFVENHVGPADRTAIISTSGRKEMAQEFTNNRQRLLTTIAKFEMGFGAEQTRSQFDLQGNANLLDASGIALEPSLGRPTLDTTRSAMFSLTAIANWLAQIPGRRKSIVLFSERMGEDNFTLNNFTIGLQNDESADFRSFVEATARGNVGLYIIDPVGVPSGAGARGTFVDDITESGPGSQFNFLRREALKSLAESTGGFAVTGSNDYTTGFDRIVEENSTYYMLGYSSTNVRQDGMFRRVKVEVTRPGLTVRSRAGYFSRDPKPPKPPKLPPGVSASLGGLLESPVPVPGLTMQVAAPVFRDEKNMGSVAVIVEARGQDLQFFEDQDNYRGAMEIAISALDADGRQKAGEKGVVNMGMTAALRDDVSRSGVRLLSRMQLKPGKYRLRVAAVDAGTVGQQRGLVMYDLDVPDFSKTPLAMSGIAIATTGTSQIQTAGPDRRLPQTLRANPTASREFAASERMRDYLEIYDSDRLSKHDIKVTTTVRREDGPRVFVEEQTLASEAGTTKDKTLTLPISSTIDLNTFQPGGYVLTIEARHSVNPAWVVSKEVPFKVKR